MEGVILTSLLHLPTLVLLNGFAHVANNEILLTGQLVITFFLLNDGYKVLDQ